MFKKVRENREYLQEFLPWLKQMRTLINQKKYLYISARIIGRVLRDLLILFLQSSGAYLGNIEAHSLAWQHKRAEIGYWLSKEFQGYGYMSETVNILTG